MLAHRWLALAVIPLFAWSDGGDGPCSSASHFPAHVIQSSIGGAENTNKDASQAEGPPNPTEIDVTVLPSFRYVKIQDTGGVTSGPTPGADIDALEVLNAQ
jgi:hypothetical protein